MTLLFSGLFSFTPVQRLSIQFFATSPRIIYTSLSCFIAKGREVFYYIFDSAISIDFFNSETPDNESA